MAITEAVTAHRTSPAVLPAREAAPPADAAPVTDGARVADAAPVTAAAQVTAANTAPAGATADRGTGGRSDSRTGRWTSSRRRGSRKGGSTSGSGKDSGQEAAGQAPFTPIPVWFFAFEGLMGASYDILKSAPNGWMVLVAVVAVNIVLARTVLRGRLKMAKAILKGRRTRVLAVGLIALRVGVHAVLGFVGMQATSGPAHIAFAVVMCAATVALLAFDQRVMLRALNRDRGTGAASAAGAAAR